jgi:hypothetical protein
MNPFIKNNIKPSLAQETRVLTMPDGEPYPVTAFKLCWKALDFLVEFGTYEQDQLVRMALVMAQASGRGFEREFFNMVAIAHRYLYENLNADGP